VIKIKFLLIYPPLKSHTAYWLPHLGLGYISAILAKNGYKTEVIDTVINRWDFCDFEIFFRKIINPDAVIITATTSEIYSAHKIASIVKKRNKQIITIVGGPHTTALPKKTLEQFKDFDIAAFGEGELTILDIAEKLKNKQPMKLVNGIAYRSGEKIVLNQKKMPITNLDKLPFPEWNKFPLQKYRSILDFKKVIEFPIITGRGCPNHCIFCQNVLGHKVRYRSIKNIINEIEYNIKLGAQSIYFCDETFTLNKSRTKKLLKEMIKRYIGKRIFWHCETRVDSVDEELLLLMKKAGCRMVGFGVESGSDYILKKTKKGITKAQIINAFNLTKKVGIKTYMFLLFGLPYETRETIKQTINFMMDTNPTYVSIGLLVPFPGTEVAEMAKSGKGEIKLLSTDWKDYEKQSGDSLIINSLKNNDHKKLQIKAYMKFYLRPSRISNLFEFVNLRGLVRFILDRLGVR